jgi:predicted enzyme related to lactoylglutathione lyase
LFSLTLCGALTTAVSAQTSDSELLVRTHGLNINVEDMDQAIAFYTETLGFEIASRQDYPKEVVLKTNDRIKLTLRAVKKLMKVNASDTRVSFTLQVNDLDEAIARMKERGVQLDAEKRKEGVGSAITISDPSGRRISLMHQTIRLVEPFKEPKIYNFGFYIPDMDEGRSFYHDKLGFIEMTQKYLPGDMPLVHKNLALGYFMLHSRPGVQRINSAYPNQMPWYTVVFETDNLVAAVDQLKKNGIKVLTAKPQKGSSGRYIAFADPFGNVSELLEVTPQTKSGNNPSAFGGK